MSIEQDINRIATALEGILACARGEGAPVQAPAVEAPKRTARAKKAEPVVAEADVVPGVAEVEPPVAPDVLGDDSGPKTGAELRTQAQQYIVAADKVGATEKLVTFIQSVAKIFNPAEPKLIKIPDAKVPEAAKMIAEWCGKNGITV